MERHLLTCTWDTDVIPFRPIEAFDDDAQEINAGLHPASPTDSGPSQLYFASPSPARPPSPPASESEVGAVAAMLSARPPSPPVGEAGEQVADAGGAQSAGASAWAAAAVAADEAETGNTQTKAGQMQKEDSSSSHDADIDTDTNGHNEIAKRSGEQLSAGLQTSCVASTDDTAATGGGGCTEGGATALTAITKLRAHFNVDVRAVPADNNAGSPSRTSPRGTPSSQPASPTSYHNTNDVNRSQSPGVLNSATRTTRTTRTTSPSSTEKKPAAKRGARLKASAKASLQSLRARLTRSASNNSSPHKPGSGGGSAIYPGPRSPSTKGEMQMGGAGAALGRVAAAISPAARRPQPTQIELNVKALLSNETAARDSASLALHVKEKEELIGIIGELQRLAFVADREKAVLRNELASVHTFLDKILPTVIETCPDVLHMTRPT